jgi:hypothetical protein
MYARRMACESLGSNKLPKSGICPIFGAKEGYVKENNKKEDACRLIEPACLLHRLTVCA